MEVQFTPCNNTTNQDIMMTQNYIDELSKYGDPHPIKRRYFEKWAQRVEWTCYFNASLSFIFKDLEMRFTIATSFLVERLTA